MERTARAVLALAFAVSVFASPGSATISHGVEIVNKTASPVAVSVELNIGHQLGHLDLGPGATGHLEIPVRLETVRVRGSACAASMQTSSRTARSYKVTIVQAGARRCQVNIYPVG